MILHGYGGYTVFVPRSSLLRRFIDHYGFAQVAVGCTFDPAASS